MKRNTNKIRWITISVALVLVLIASYLAIAYQRNFWPFLAASLDIDSRQDTTNESPKNNNPIKKEDSAPTINQDKNSDQVPISEEFSATITQLEQTGDVVNFAAKINNPPSTGSCVLTFTNPNDRPVTKQFDSTTKDNVTICGPVAIPALEFSYLGEWAVSLRYYVGSAQAVINGKVTIR